MFKHPVSKQHHKLGFDDTALHRRSGAFEILWRFLLESQIGHVLFAHDVKSKAFPGFQARSVVDSARRPYASARAGWTCFILLSSRRYCNQKSFSYVWGNGCVTHLLHCLHSQIGRLFLVCRMFGSQKCPRHVCWHVGSEQLEDFRSDNLRVAS